MLTRHTSRLAALAVGLALAAPSGSAHSDDKPFGLPSWAESAASDDPPGFPDSPGGGSGPPGFPGDPGSGGDAPAFPGDPTSVPLDGGLGLLALAGGAYAVRRLRQH